MRGSSFLLVLLVSATSFPELKGKALGTRLLVSVACITFANGILDFSRHTSPK